MKLAFLTFLALVLNIDCKPKINGYKISVLSGSNFVNFVRLLENETITKCSLIIYSYGAGNNASIPLDLQNKTALDTEGIQINSLGEEMCGVMFLNFTQEYPNVYAFDVQYKDKNGISHNEVSEFTATVVELTYPDKIRLVKIGTALHISCNIKITSAGIDSVTLDWQLVNPHGEKIINHNKGEYATSKASLPDYGVWKCSTIIANTMEPITFEIDVKLAEDAGYKVVTWYNETGDSATVGCKCPTELFENCYFTRPDDKMLAISRNGVVTERYTSMGTNFDDHTCQIEFKLPVLTEERGRWKCNLGNTGGFVDVKATGIPDYIKRTSKRVQLKTHTDIFCKVPYSTDGCYIQAPDGTIYPGGYYYNFQQGECIYSLYIESPEVMGEWSCHFSKPNSPIDDVITVQLSLYDSLTSKYSEVEVDESDSAQLMCSSLEAIQYCRFLSPNNVSFHVSRQKTSPDFQYVGRGFEYGECGIKINSIKAEYDGNWTCFVKGMGPSLGRESDGEFNSTTRISVNPISGVSTASSVGIPVGIMAVAVVLVVGAVFYRYKKRTSYENEPRNSLESNSSNTNVPIVSATTLNAMYSPNSF